MALYAPLCRESCGPPYGLCDLIGNHCNSRTKESCQHPCHGLEHPPQAVAQSVNNSNQLFSIKIDGMPPHDSCKDIIHQVESHTSSTDLLKQLKTVTCDILSARMMARPAQPSSHFAAPMSHTQCTTGKGRSDAHFTIPRHSSVTHAWPWATDKTFVAAPIYPASEFVALTTQIPKNRTSASVAVQMAAKITLPMTPGARYAKRMILLPARPPT